MTEKKHYSGNGHKWLFIGSKAFGFSCLEVLSEIAGRSLCAVITMDDREDSRSAFSSLQTFTGQTTPLHTLKKQNELEAIIRGYSPDLIFVCGWYRLFSPELLALPPLGFINFHFSLLPKYRGGAPVVWAIINGDTKSGYSLFQLAPGADTGPLFAQGTVPIAADDYIADVYARIEIQALEALRESFPKILRGELQPVPQSSEGVSYAAQRSPADGRIDWRWPRQRIYDFIRAQSRPYPGAFTLLDGKKLTIWRATVSDKSPYWGTPGQVAEFAGESALIICGDTLPLCIDTVSLDGDARTPKEALRTINTRL